jgi:hypothetical protein
MADNRLDKFRKAVALSVEGERVTFQSIGDGDFHFTPRKFSKKHAAKLRQLQIQGVSGVSPKLSAKLQRIQKEHAGDGLEEAIAAELTDEELTTLMTSMDPEAQTEVEKRRILYGVAEQDLSDVPGPMTEEIAELIMENRDVAQEVLDAVDALNPPLAGQTQD